MKQPHFNIIGLSRKIQLKKYTIPVLAAVMLSSIACEKTNSLFPPSGDTDLSIIPIKPPVKDTVPTQPTYKTNWGDTVAVPKIPAGNFLITDFGAATTAADNTAAIQKAIDEATKAGGGTVVVPAGTFNCGPLKLKNNVGLLVSDGAVLKVLAYEVYPGAGTTAAVASFLDLSGAKNVLVTGKGVIDGQGAAWWAAYSASKATGGIARPAMVNFDNANTVEIEGITIQDAPNSHISVHRGNKHVTILGVTLNSPSNSPNTDGIDVWSPNVNILNCNISCGDDNIAMNNDTKFVTIAGCTFGKGHGLSIGSYTSNIDHIYVNNCTFDGTDNGVHIKSSRERSGTVEYLVYEKLTMTNVSTPINVCEYYPDNTIPASATADQGQAVTATTPVWRNIVFKNITATGSNNAGLLWSVPEKHMRNLVFDNVNIAAKTGMKMNNVDSAAFINASKIAVTSGNAFVSSSASTITGIDLTTGAAK